MKKLENKHKVLFVTPYFPPHAGGVQNYVYNIAKGLYKEKEWTSVIVTSDKNIKSIRVEKKEGMKIYKLPILFTFSNTPINPFWYFQLRKIISEENPDLINAHSPVPFMADIAALVSSTIPFILTYHSGTMKKKKLFYDIFILLYEQILLRNTSRKALGIICSSNFVKRTMFEHHLSKSSVVYPGVDINVFKPSGNKKDMGRVLFIGRKENYEMKGLFNLIEAMNKIPNTILYVIGEKIALQKKNIIWLGSIHLPRIVKEIQKSALVVLPSHAQTESFGMVLIEAMACKIPVIGTNIGGIPEVIDNNKNGLIVSPSNSDEITTAIKKILNNPKLAQKMGEDGYKKVKENFTWDIGVSKTAKIFSQYLQ